MKKRSAIILPVAVVVIILAIAAIFLYERSKVAMIIDDEAVWDAIDTN